MTELTDRQKVLAKYPEAETYCCEFDYFEVWAGKCVGSGRTESEAWRSAARRLEQTPTLPSNQEK